MEKKLQSLDEIWLTGGGSKSRIWPQMFADVLDHPIHVAKCDELGCRGAALCAGIALGWFPLDELPELEKQATYYPRKRFTEIYKEQKEIYEYAYKLSSALWKN